MWLGCHEESCSIIEAEQRLLFALDLYRAVHFKTLSLSWVSKSLGYKAGMFFTCTGIWIIYTWAHISWQWHHVRENMLCEHKGDFIVFLFHEFFSINTNHVFEEDKNPVQLSRKCCTGDGACIFAVDLHLVSSTSLQPTQTLPSMLTVHITCWHKPKTHPAAPGNVREVLEEKPMKVVCFLWSHLCSWRGRLRWRGCGVLGQFFCHPLISDKYTTEGPGFYS